MSVDLVWAGARYVCTPAPEPDPAPAPSPLRVIGFSQRDPRWAAVHLGGSSLTMGGSGCAVTACAMLGSLADCTKTPLDLVTWLNANGGFTSGGLLYWYKAAEGAGLGFVNYHLWRKEPADLDKLRAALAVMPQVVQVDFKPATAALDTHFVVAESLTADGLDINMVDPWTGSRGTVLGAYGAPGWTLARAIYAMAEFKP